jgi:hypothetical protein
MDEYTEIKYVLLQVEKGDENFFRAKGIQAGYIIVIQILSGEIGASGGYKFIPEYGESISDRSAKIENSGTTNALSLLLNSVEDIKMLPSSINVNDLRESWLSLKNKYITIKNSIDKLIDDGFDIFEGGFKKILFKENWSNSYTIGIVNEDLELIYTTSKSGVLIIGDYMWIPIKELSDKEWSKCKELCNVSGDKIKNY